MFVAGMAPWSYCLKSADTYRITILKARIGETDSILLKLPQLLSNLVNDAGLAVLGGVLDLASEDWDRVRDGPQSSVIAG